MERRPRTRGPRGRGRGVRTRGGRGVGGVVVERRMSLTWTSDLPLGVPLERPKYPKRKRTWSPKPDQPGTSGIPNPTPPARPTLLSDDNNINTQIPYLESPAVLPSPAFFVECTSSTGSSAAATMPALSPSPGPFATPCSPAIFLEYISGASSSIPLVTEMPPPPAILFHLDELENYGSELDDTSDDDDDGLVLVQRRNATIIDTPFLDEPEDGYTDTLNTQNETDTASYLPRDFFDFQWTSFPKPPIQPELRRETFSSTNVGPTSIFSDSYEAFTAIWNHEIMEHIANETNRYAQRTAQTLIDTNKISPNSRICDWRDTCVQELYVFFALVLAMGVVIKSKLADYWNTSNDIFSTPGFRAYMTLRRFQLLSQCLHFNNNENLNPAQMDRAQAKLYKIQPIVTHLNNIFQNLYVLSQNIALDESLLQWKGWLDINQLIPNKKAKIGVKSYEVCESTTGYLWRFEIHSHQKQSSVPGLAAVDPMRATIPSIVLRLVQGLENKGHTLWMDNYYNSPALARKLKSIGFDCVGTLRTNRQFVPETLSNLTKSQMREGQIAGLTSGDVDLMVWRDKNLVGTISTYHGNAVTYVDGTPRPILISDYNVMMGGVDRKDQMISSYPIERKRTKIWYKKLFRRFLNISVLNAYIIVKHSNSSITHRDFRLRLIKSLLENNSVKTPVVPPTSTIFEAKKHHLSEYPLLPGKSQRLRRKCAICKKRVAMYCVGCEKAVCMQPCFVALHQ